MQDTKNLIRKRDVVYPEKVKSYELKKDFESASYWKKQILIVSEKIVLIESNRRKNIKQSKKSGKRHIAKSLSKKK